MWELIRRFLAACFGCMSRGLEDPTPPTIQVIVPGREGPMEPPPLKAADGHSDPSGRYVLNITMVNGSPEPHRRHHHRHASAHDITLDDVEERRAALLHLHPPFRRSHGSSHLNPDRLSVAAVEGDEAMERKANHRRTQVI